jgi:hypothetical protein
MLNPPIADLDSDATLAAVEANEAAARATDAGRLALAAHWADLHGALDRADGPARPAAERLVHISGEGTPEVAEFAPAELGAALRMSPTAAEELVAEHPPHVPRDYGRGR